MATLIGTPPNIIIASIRAETLGEPFRMFDFAPVGGMAAIAGLAFVSLIGWRLIPNRGPQEETSEALAEYIAELTLPPESPAYRQAGQRACMRPPRNPTWPSSA